MISSVVMPFWAEPAEPAGLCPVEVGHDRFHALSIVPARPGFDGTCFCLPLPSLIAVD